MLADFKHKRKSAGFIRNSSNKALPTFKMLQKNESSDDFSSFEAQKPREESQGQFSPYKHPPNNIPSKPPLPVKSRHVAKQPIQIFTNEKLKRNYQANNFIQSPNRGKIVNVRQEQIKETMRKRAQVSNQLAQIDKICNKIQSLKSPQSYKDRYQKLMSQINHHKSLQKKSEHAHRQKPSLSHQKSSSKKFKIQQQQEQQQHQISFDSKRKKHSPIPTPKNKQQFFNQVQNQGQATKLNNHHKSKQSYTGMQQKSRNYQFEQSDLSSNQGEQQNQEQQEQLQQPQFHQNTFKPNANKQILNSIRQYQKTHPEVSFKNQNQKYENKYNKKPQFTQKQRMHRQDNKLKYQHDNARRRFISQKQQKSDSDHPQQQVEAQVEQQEQQSEDLINQYPKQQFKKTTIKQCVQMRENIPHKNNKNLKTQQNESGLYKTKGGICFDLDVNQFTQNDTKPVSKPTQYIPKKLKKVDTKQEILKRRQMAKNYDKHARAVVFGGY